MSLKAELLQFLSQMPDTETARMRKAFLTFVGFDYLSDRLNHEGTNRAFFNDLLELLFSEGQTKLVTFLENIVAREWVGLEGRDRLNEFIERIQVSAAHPEPPFYLPQEDVSTFTGRETELRRLEERLLDRPGAKICTIVGLSGSGGVGKSALACHFATKHRDRFPDGIIGLRVDGKDIDTIAREFVRRCGKDIDAEEERDAATLMRDVFAHRRMLLIFDNAIDASIKKLRPGGNCCAVIVTTRDRTLPNSLDISDGGSIDLDPLPTEDCRLLLEKILGQKRVEDESDATYHIIRLVGNLPLALQIAGGTLRGRPRSLADYAASLEQEKTRLSRLKLGKDEDLNVDASLNLSWELLREEERDFFVCLSACAEDGFARRTAMATAGLEDEWSADDYLQILYNFSLLNAIKTGNNRFVLHPLVRVFAANRARERGLVEVARERHATFFVEWLQSDDLENSTDVARVAEDLDDVILAAQWLQDRPTETKKKGRPSYKFVLKLQPLFEKYGYWQKAIVLVTKFQEWAKQVHDWNSVVKYQTHEARYRSFLEEFDRAEEILDSAQSNLSHIENLETRKRREAKLLNVLRGIFKKQGKVEQAIRVFREQILVEEEIGDECSLAIVCNRLGVFLQSQGKLEEARQVFEREIAIAETLDDRSQLAIGLNCLGRLLQQQGDLEEAQQCFERGIAIAETLDDLASLAIGLNRLGGLLQQQGKLEEVRQVFERQIAIAENLNDLSQLAVGLKRLGGLLQQQGKLEEARQVFERRIATAETLNDLSQLVFELNCLGGLLQQQNKLEEARQAFERQITIAENLNDLSQLAIGLNCLGGLLQQQNKLEEARKAFERRIAIAETLNDLSQLVIGLNCLGKLLQQQEKLEEARQVFERQITIAETLNDRLHLAIGLNYLGKLLQQQGKLEEVRQVFEKQIAVAETLKDLPSLSIGLNRLGGLLQQQSDLEEARQVFERQIAVAEALNNYASLSIGLNRLGGLLQQQGNLEEAQKAFEKQIAIAETPKELLLTAKNLHYLGIAWKSQGNFEKAEELLRKSREICESIKDLPTLSKVLNTLGGVLDRQKKWEEAEKILRQSYDIAVQLEDKRGQAITLNSLGQVIANQPNKENFLMFFKKSIELGEELNDRSHLAQVYTAMGKALSSRRNYEEAVTALSRGFSIDENLSNLRGLKIITPNLTFALTMLGKREEALEYCDRALKIAPDYPGFLSLQEKLQTAIAKGIPVHFPKTGSVLFIQYNEKENQRWGRILPDDGSPQITFNEQFIGSKIISQLVTRSLVEVEIKETPQGLYAKKIRIIEDEDSIEEENDLF